MFIELNFLHNKLMLGNCMPYKTKESESDVV